MQTKPHCLAHSSTGERCKLRFVPSKHMLDLLPCVTANDLIPYRSSAVLALNIKRKLTTQCADSHLFVSNSFDHQVEVV